MKRIYKIKSSHVTTEPLLDKVICKSTILLRMIETGLEFLEKSSINLPANIRLDEDVLKTSWRHLWSSSSEDVSKTSSRRLDQDEYIRLNHTSSEDVFKTSRENVFKTSSRRFQDVFKTSSRRLQDVLQKRLQDIFKTFWKRLQDIFKTFSRRIIKLNCSW